MCYPVCGIVHIKELLLLNRKSSLCGSSWFPLSLSELFFTICLMPYNRKKNVFSASLNKSFPFFFLPVRKVLVIFLLQTLPMLKLILISLLSL